MSAQLADVSFDRVGAISIAAVSGEVDMSNAASVRRRVEEAVTPDDEALILDLSGLSFIDSAGLHSVFELGAALEERRQRLYVCADEGGQVERTIEIVGMPRAVSVHRALDEAIAAARASATGAQPFSPGDDR